MLITGLSKSGKINSLFNFVSHQSDIDQIYLYVKHLYEAKYQLLNNKQESTGLKHFRDFKTFIDYLNDIEMFTKILKNIMLIRNRKY